MLQANRRKNSDVHLKRNCLRKCSDLTVVKVHCNRDYELSELYRVILNYCRGYRL
jgi:hypothetical protein